MRRNEYPTCSDPIGFGEVSESDGMNLSAVLTAPLYPKESDYVMCHYLRLVQTKTRLKGTKNIDVQLMLRWSM